MKVEVLRLWELAVREREEGRLGTGERRTKVNRNRCQTIRPRGPRSTRLCSRD
jgi:hypothetical protein